MPAASIRPHRLHLGVSMKRHIPSVIMSMAFLALMPFALLQAAEPPHPGAFPGTGKAGAFAGPATDFTSFGRGVSPKSARAALAGLSNTGPVMRGGAESAIYRRISPSVVLVVSDKGLGSGSLISKDGQILTNYHVVAGFMSVNVILKPAKEGDKVVMSQAITADVIKVDPHTDLALLKMRQAPPADRTPLAFGDFSKISVGDDVNAIGHPEGETWTFTKGYVSQIRRDYKWKVDGTEHQADVIQTQTPINPGNPGGPLLNSSGALIGVNSFIATDGQNLSFAVGVDAVQDFIKNPETVTVASAVEAAGTKCEPKVTFEGRNKENNANVREIDLFCRGKAGLAVILPDDTSKPLIALVDLEGTGKPQGIIYSYHRDGHWDISYWDTKHTGHFDTIGYHPDGKLEPSSYGPYVPDQKQAAGTPATPPPSSDTGH
jgi:S1-C subfamily serine protease